MSKAKCIKCGKICHFGYYKVRPGACLCASCYQKMFKAKHNEKTVTISYPEEKNETD